MAKKPKSKEFICGFELAESQFLASEKYKDKDLEFNNPFPEGTDEWKGYKEAVYIFTQK